MDRRTRRMLARTLVVGLLGSGTIVCIAASRAASGVLRLPAQRQQPTVQVGPGPVRTELRAGSYRLELRLAPNRASRRGVVAVTLVKGGRPVENARVRLTVTMLDMNMGNFTVPLPETGTGTYARTAPVLGMSGRWGWRFDVTPAGGKRFSIAVADRMGS
jgi:hypothetical protein